MAGDPPHDAKHGIRPTSLPLSHDKAPSYDDASERNPHEPSRSAAPPTPSPLSIWRKLYDVATWTPPRCRWDPERPPEFSMWLNVLFGVSGAFTVANLYYNHPILNVLADDFGVPYEKVSQIPTVMQAGYAAGLLFLCPLGDLLRRRAFVLCLVFFTATMWIGLCLTNSLSAFTAISFITAITTVTPQLMLPLVGDLAPPHRRAAALSIVVSGLLLGMLIARLLSGILTNYTSWRTIYWLSLGLQYGIFALLWLFMPDYPSTNPGGINYFRLLWGIVEMLFHEPVLVQACCITFFTAATFTCFWTTLTFLLSSPPYSYDSLVIGLFALIGIGSMFLGPLWAKLVIDRFVPLFSVILGELWCMLGICIGTYVGRFCVAGPIIQAFLNDFGLQMAQIANRSAIYSIAPKARNRVNTAFMVATFCGQLVGTAAGNHLYARAGWLASGSYSVGSIGMALLFCFARGPWEEGWFGWSGGWSVRKKNAQSADGKAVADNAAVAKEAHGAVVAEESGRDGKDLEKGILEEKGREQTHTSEVADPKNLLVLRAAEDGQTVVPGIGDRDKEEEEQKSLGGSSNTGDDEIMTAPNKAAAR
ncbi:hypothetical protein MBLNU459_g0595t1 [Dothideomycetes sp. NU459]